MSRGDNVMNTDVVIVSLKTRLGRLPRPPGHSFSRYYNAVISSVVLKTVQNYRINFQIGAMREHRKISKFTTSIQTFFAFEIYKKKNVFGLHENCPYHFRTTPKVAFI